jgi:hypothetical protein
MIRSARQNPIGVVVDGKLFFPAFFSTLTGDFTQKPPFLGMSVTATPKSPKTGLLLQKLFNLAHFFEVKPSDTRRNSLHIKVVPYDSNQDERFAQSPAGG